RGYDVLGLDRNEAFIRLAREKSRTTDPPPRFLVGDMRDLGDVGRFDALISMFGAFGHLAREEVRDTLSGFQGALEPGGVLAFEWWNTSGATDGHMDWLERSDEALRVIRLGKSMVDATGPLLHLSLRHLILQDGSLADEFTEEGMFPLYSVEEIRALLVEADLEPLATLDWTSKTLDTYQTGGFRAFSVARKER
ncbi:MAG: class I SAM-dependent methyltransferase, partial [Thermoplasmata archaeon]|nr:class I SAM-dependent methyltransferase [Thermoplasmata archaeon]